MTFQMDKQLLQETANQMVSAGKGVLAIDESTGTCTKRFDALGVESTEQSRRDYRHMLISTPDLGNYVSGVIMYDETLRQKSKEGKSFIEVLKEQGILAGIKVDTGTKDMALFEGEKVTEGLDGLKERLEKYSNLGAKFAKWRAVITITDKTPTDANLVANAHGLARYAALCQEAGIVPIIEPEVLMDGNHSIDKSFEVTAKTIKTVYEQLNLMQIYLPGTILKPSMIVSGKNNSERANYKEVAEKTLKCLKENVPNEVSGIAFLSGGQSEIEAVTHLNEINKLGSAPWPITFSFGRALQQPALNKWASDQNNITGAQAELLHRVKCSGSASKAEYSEELENSRS